jgi:zinc/manganese transport system permease protein
VERGVIFVDLALAQIAALGPPWQSWWAWIRMDGGLTGSAWASHFWARPFALARTRRGHIPQEAFIGIAYAVASATAILLMGKATGEAEHLKDMLVETYWRFPERKFARRPFCTGAVEIFHYIFRKKFLQISMHHNDTEKLNFNVKFWDFLFYASFGFVVTSSVAIAGVLLVFCYLIVPSVGAMLFADRIGPRLAIGWTMGTLVSALGVILSVKIDTPTGATIVVTFGGVLILMFLLHLILDHGRHARLLEGAMSSRHEV